MENSCGFVPVYLNDRSSGSVSSRARNDLRRCENPFRFGTFRALVATNQKKVRYFNLHMRLKCSPADDSVGTTDSDKPEIIKKPNAFIRLLQTFGFIQSEENKSMVAKLRSYGLAAVLSYGIFDAITYGFSFILALKGYQASTGSTLTLKTFPQIFALMWGINNFSRPFRIAGALFLAPSMDLYIIKPIKARFNNKNSNKSQHFEEVQEPNK
mmetsp:Transcript_2330/g.4085  ORF Transcript_2330/g.4085 Transcript_2330/m.4085 type:complete len:212 (-) Transcript_2330:30-665(-)